MIGDPPSRWRARGGRRPSARLAASDVPCLRPTNRESTAMSKGMDSKKEQKKKPAKTAKEKKAEKNEKKTTRGFAPT